MCGRAGLNFFRFFVFHRTKETLESGNLLSVINVLMQLRKVCNHPNMFEVRPTISPFRMEGLSIQTSSLIANMLDYDPFNVRIFFAPRARRQKV